jgi:hypothetical protein
MRDMRYDAFYDDMICDARDVLYDKVECIATIISRLYLFNRRYRRHYTHAYI